MTFAAILEKVRQYYDRKLQLHGATPRGVDWNSPEAQGLRFEQLLRVCDRTGAFSINEYGCGYGALVQYMIDRGYAFQYRGFDISEQMIAKAMELHSDLGHCQFFTDESRLTAADYTVASGVFNVKLQTSDEEWGHYVLHTLGRIAGLSERGFAFNILTKYSDRELMRSDLYYADPLFFFDYCKRHFSRSVSLLHDYPLYEFTILVKKRVTSW
jgi:SAM-dependent methyltransferase